MENRSGEIHISTDEARGGSTSHVVRWVLGISLLAAIALLSALWMTGAALQNGDEPSSTKTAVTSGASTTTTTTSNRADENDTDSNVADRAE